MRKGKAEMRTCGSAVRWFICISAFLTFCLSAPAAKATVVQEVVTPGGLTAWLVEEHALPLVAVKIAFKESGVASDTPEKSGRASMAAAMLPEGAGALNSNDFNEALETDAVNLHFGVDEDLFYASLDSVSDHTEKAFSYLGMALTQPRFDKDALERVRRQTLADITQREQQPGYMLGRAWQQLAYGAHPYGQPSLGTRASVAKLTKEDISGFTQQALARDNILISVVGDITPKQLAQLLDTHLGTLPAKATLAAKVSDIQLPDGTKEVRVTHDIPQTMIAFGTPGLMRSDPDYYSAYVMNQILGGGGSLTSKLGTEIREKRGLAYSVSTQLDPMSHSASWQGMFATRNEKAAEAMDVLKTTLKDFSANGPTDAEISDAKTFLTGSFVMALDSNADIASFLINMQLHHLGRDYLDKRNGLIENVKKDDVKRLAARLTDPGKLLVVMVGKPDEKKVTAK